MVGLYGGAPLEYAGINEQGSDAVPSTASEVLGATFGEGVSHGLFFRALREDRRHVAEFGGIDAFGVVNRPEPTIDAESANAEYGIPGHLSFDAPVAPTVARDLHDHKRAQILREDILARREGGVGTGAAARFTTSMAAGLLDPINVAVGFIPIIGPAREAALIAGAAGAAGRAGIRAGIGAGAGAAGMAALQPLEFALSRQEREDYTMADAMRSIALGTILGGGLHAGVGGLIDRASGRYRNPLSQALEDAGPDAREAALHGALAQTIEGRPVDVAPVFGDASKAASFRDWFGASKVVNESGEPKIVYHGTPRGGFDEFNMDLAGSNLDTGFMGRGAYFTDRPDVAGYYATTSSQEAPTIIPSYFSLQNPFFWGQKTQGARALVLRGERLPEEIHDDVIKRTKFEFDKDAEPDHFAERDISETIRRVLIEKGYDGVIADLPSGGREYVAFMPEQIRSIFSDPADVARGLATIGRREPEVEPQARVMADEATDRPNETLQTIQQEIADLEQRMAPPEQRAATPDQASVARIERPTEADIAAEIAEARARAIDQAAVCITRGG